MDEKVLTKMYMAGYLMAMADVKEDILQALEHIREAAAGRDPFAAQEGMLMNAEEKAQSVVLNALFGRTDIHIKALKEE